MVNNNNKVWLNEISFMRPILLVLLVSYHAFAPYCSAWPALEDMKQLEIYNWIALFSRAFRLEAFVFISGYVFTFQLLTKDKFNNVWALIRNKVQRLLIPCVAFGIIYYICFHDTIPNVSYVKILTGIGHLWYLPCLFWLFIFQYLIIKKSQKSPTKKYLTGGVFY